MIVRHFRPLLAAFLAIFWFAPLPCFAQAALEQRIGDIRELSRFVPDQALIQLQKIEAAARGAAAPTAAEFLSQLAIARMRLGQNDAALALAEEGIALARNRHDDTLLAKGLLTKAYVVFAMDQQAASHALVFQAEKLAHAGNDPELRAQATITAGQAWAEQGNFPAALAKLQQGADLARRLDSHLALARALNALALLYIQMKEYEKGDDVLRESLNLAETLRSPGLLAIARSTEYGLALDSGQPQRALKALLLALELERRIGARAMIATTLVNLSDNYLKARDYPKALQYANQSLDAARLIRDRGTEATARVNIGLALLGMGRLAEGRKSAEAGLRYYETMANKPDLQLILVEYGNFLERAGDMAGAVSAYHRERAISNELFERQRQKSIYELQEKYEADKTKRRIELLSRENALKSTELDNRRLQQRIWWLAAAVCALGLLVIGLLYRKVRQANSLLHHSNRELKQQSAVDPLTALYNRRHFQEFMRHYEAPQSRAGGDDIVGALFLLDVDHFKQINDQHGHAAGDAVLKMIADQLRVLLRETDMIVRWGGEEFLAFLPAVPRGRLDEIARRVLNGIAASAVDYQGRRIAVQVSLGFSPFPLTPLDAPLTWERAVNLVDMALYLAKTHGRNRAYGVRGFHNIERTTMEALEQDLEQAWRAGFVDLSVVLGEAAEPSPPGPAGRGSNVVPLKPPARNAGN